MGHAARAIQAERWSRSSMRTRLPRGRRRPKVKLGDEVPVRFVLAVHRRDPLRIQLNCRTFSTSCAANVTRPLCRRPVHCVCALPPVHLAHQRWTIWAALSGKKRRTRARSFRRTLAAGLAAPRRAGSTRVCVASVRTPASWRPPADAAHRALKLREISLRIERRSNRIGACAAGHGGPSLSCFSSHC